MAAGGGLLADVQRSKRADPALQLAAIAEGTCSPARASLAAAVYEDGRGRSYAFVDTYIEEVRKVTIQRVAALIVQEGKAP